MTNTTRWEGTALKGLAAFTLMILAASACGPAAEPPPPPPPPPPPMVGSDKPDNGMAGIPGVDRTATRNYLLSLGWGDNLPDSQVVEAQLTWGNNSGTVRIVPAVTANSVSWQSALGGGPGHFVAKIYNLENKPLGPFGLGPLEDGYLWIGEISTNQRGVAIYTVKNSGVAVRAPVNLTLAGYCQEPHAVPSVKLQEPRCPPIGDAAQQTGASNGPRIFLASATSAAVSQGGRGLWVSCSGGCCEVGGTQVD